MAKKANIWHESKVHISSSGPLGKPLCGASGNATLKVVVGYTYVPPSATCLRCIRAFEKKCKAP